MLETPDDDILDVGIATCRFFFDGDWKPITIDTRLPYAFDSDNQIPLFSHPRNPRELWPQLLQKAYAKFLGCYGRFHAAPSTLAEAFLEDDDDFPTRQYTPSLLIQALTELSGGLVERVEIPPHFSSDIATEVWYMIRKCHENGHLVLAMKSELSYAQESQAGRSDGGPLTSVRANLPSSGGPQSVATGKRKSATGGRSSIASNKKFSAFSSKGTYDKSRMATQLCNSGWGATKDSSDGLRSNLVYPIVYSVEAGKAPHKLLKCRDPWENSQWRGAWSNDSLRWSEHPEIEASLWDDPAAEFDRSDDNYFWCEWEDAVLSFNEFYIVKFWESSSKFTGVDGMWEGRTAAGPMTKEIPNDTNEPLATGRQQVSRHICCKDPDPNFLLNPQYRVKLPPPKMNAKNAKLAGRATMMQALKAALAETGHTEDDTTANVASGSEEVNVSVTLLQHAYESIQANSSLESLNTKDNPSPLLPPPVYTDFLILKRPRAERGKIWTFSKKDVVFDSTTSDARTIVSELCPNHYQDLVPKDDFANPDVFALDLKFSESHSYVLIPYTEQEAIERPFTLRLVSSKALNVKYVPDPHVINITGKWRVDTGTAGGMLTRDDVSMKPSPFLGSMDYISPGVAPLHTSLAAAVHTLVGTKETSHVNHLWGMNPQIHLSLKTVKGEQLGRNQVPQRNSDSRGNKHEVSRAEGLIDMVVTLKRIDNNVGRDEREDGTRNKIGLYATRPVKKIEDDGTKFPKRRLEIGPREFCQVSECSEEAVASFHLRLPRAWFVNDDDEYYPGILIHPCMRFKNTDGDFRLSVYTNADYELHANDLAADPYYLTIPGAWTWQQTAGGCHMNSSWLRNPAFVVRPVGPKRDINLKITLHRPEAQWAAKYRQDGVGTMLGFYVITCDEGKEARSHDGLKGLLARTQFKAEHEISAEITMPFGAPQLDQKEVLIIPTTYSPKSGPFFITVESDRKISLLPYQDDVVKSRDDFEQ